MISQRLSRRCVLYSSSSARGAHVCLMPMDHAGRPQVYGGSALEPPPELIALPGPCQSLKDIATANANRRWVCGCGHLFGSGQGIYDMHIVNHKSGRRHK